MKRNIPVSIYFMWEWWEKYFYGIYPRPEKAGDDKLEQIYLSRKRFLYESFGEFEIGERNPVMDGKYINMVLRWGMDFIPHVLGAELMCKDVGGYATRKINLETIKKLKAVNIADNAIGEWIIERKEELLKRYGSVDQAIDMESPTNVSVRIRGEEFYIDLIDDENMARNILEVVTETICLAYRFIGKEFKLNELLIGNCNVTLMSPVIYRNIILGYDLKIANIAKNVTGRINSVRLHHCDVQADKFIDAYKIIPGVFKLEASHASDIRRICREMPGIIFAAMLNPCELLQKPFEQLEVEIDKVVGDGAGELDIWNIDPLMDISRLKRMLDLIQRCCERNNCEAIFECIPFCWDELEWAFPRYQK